MQFLCKRVLRWKEEGVTVRRGQDFSSSPQYLPDQRFYRWTPTWPDLAESASRGVLGALANRNYSVPPEWNTLRLPLEDLMDPRHEFWMRQQGSPSQPRPNGQHGVAGPLQGPPIPPVHAAQPNAPDTGDKIQNLSFSARRSIIPTLNFLLANTETIIPHMVDIQLLLAKKRETNCQSTQQR